MDILQNLLRIMDMDMERPGLYGWFHLLWLGITVLTAVALCRWYPKDRKPHGLILTVTVTVILLEIYKQINYSFSYTNGITYDYQWYAFPFQFCSTPMYVGLLAALTRKGRIHDAACAYLATFSVFAGLCVMLYPADVFIDTVGINIQTMICHGSMILLGVYLLERETFNMFFISPYCAPSLPVYSLVQAVVPYPLNLVIYIAGFTLAAYLILLVAMGVRRLGQRKVVTEVS